MRKLMWFTVGFCAACIWGAYLQNRFWWIIAGVCILAGIVVYVFCREKTGAGIAAILCAGVVAGLCWFQTFDAFCLRPVRALDEQVRTVTIRMDSDFQPTEYGYVFHGTMQRNGRDYKLWVYLDRTEQPLSLSAGDQVTGPFRFALTTTGGSNESRIHQGNGVFLTASQAGDISIRNAEKAALRDIPERIRCSILARITAIFPSDSAAFAKALLLGDTGDLDYELDTAFKVSGIRHVVAVSGLHVSILFSLIYLIAGRKRILMPLVGIPLAVLFAAVAGFTPSVNRACVMQILMMAAILFDRQYDPPTALSFSVLVMLLWNPFSVCSVSLQLSVACMAGIFLFAGRIYRWMLSDQCMGIAEGKGVKARLKRWLAGSISVSCATSIMTAPLCAWYFGMVSLISAVTNLLTLWLISFIFYGIMAACVLSTIWLPAGSVLAWIVSWGIRYVQWLARIMASVPFAAVYFRDAIAVIWLVSCYVLLMVFLLMKKKRPGILICCTLLSLSVSLLSNWREPLSDRCRVTVLDVGQGQCVMLQSEGRTYLVDCGGDSETWVADEAAGILLSQGVTYLDGLILTHYDNDHACAAANLLTRVDADMILVPDVPDDRGVVQKLRTVSSGQIVYVNALTQLTYGDSVLTVYPPLKVGSGNESSMCVLFQAGNCDILITGDRDGFGERMLLRNADIPELEVLIAGHHGSRSSTCEELLRTTTPEFVFISVGADNRYGHPNQEVLTRLDEFGCMVYRTDLNGTITFRR